MCSLNVCGRDYNAPTEGEKTLGDVSALPKPMQVLLLLPPPMMMLLLLLLLLMMLPLRLLLLRSA